MSDYSDPVTCSAAGLSLADVVLGTGPKSLRTAKSRSNPASPCGNVLPTHITDHFDNIVHACLCSVTLGFRIFVLADRYIGNRASTWDWHMGTCCF